jgi:hypothetical protein
MAGGAGVAQAAARDGGRLRIGGGRLRVRRVEENVE